MSELKLVSPLLDGFTLGNVISEHNGVRCYPAIKETSDEKYILKIISVPASQVQLDALLLTGAYKDPADAMDYFQQVADSIEKEAQLLKKLSKLEGFLCYEDLQIVPMEKGNLGYEIYLLGTYKRSLERYMRRHLMTHLEAINLGLDLCQSLAICRRSGHMYVDIKPSNIYLTKGKEYRIGDLGFVDLNSLSYTSLPSRYSSPYSPPEARDDLMTLNRSVDTYGVGMVLYQIFNDGILPNLPLDSAEPLPSPANADYELAAVIMKAIAPNPADRWQDPMEMGQALINYMQCNSVNNTPLAPPRAILEDAEPMIPFAGVKAAEPIPSVPDNKSVPESTAENSPAAEEAAMVAEETSEQSVSAETSVSEEADTPPVLAPESDDDPKVESSSEPSSDAESEPIPAVPVDEDEDDFLKLLSEDYSQPQEEEEPYEEELIPEPEDPIIPQPRKKRWVLPVVLLLVLALLGAGAFYYYQNYYLQKIDGMTIEGAQYELTVNIDSDTDLSVLNVRCTDAYGNSTVQTAGNGQVVFSNLLPDSLYRIELETTGFHKLIGKTSEIFTTDALTNIVSISTITGPEDGSVILNFTVDGSDPDEWLLVCESEGEAPVSQSFTGHSVTVKGLTIGKKYTFTLSATDNTEVLGNNTEEFTVSRLVMAEDLSIVASNNGTMTVRWKQPEDVVIESWTARCYSNNGHEQIMEVTGNEVVFTEINSADAYTVEVTASGMTQPTRVAITANPITVTDFTVSEDTAGQLTVSWEYMGATPDGGWLLIYTLDGSNTQNIVKADDTTAVISPSIFGSTYHFTLQAADSTTVFSNTYQHICSEPDIFNAYGLSAEKITSYLLKTPEGSWIYDSVGSEAFCDSFAIGESISMVLRGGTDFYLPKDDIQVLFVIRDASGNVLSELTAERIINWNTLWFDGDYHFAELDIPKIPSTAGDYSISIYFNHAAVTTTTFSILE